MTRSILIEDVGPIRRLAIPAPEEGGVVVLRGGNGTGKTEAIEAVGAHMTGEGKLAPRDGALGGKVEGLGRLTTVGPATRRLGALELLGLEPDLSPAQLVDPGLKDPGAADRRRIQVACLLARVRPDASLFVPLVGGVEQLQALASSESLGAQDIVTMAFGIKRDLESAARAQEQRAEAEVGAAAGLRSSVGDVDVSQPADEAQLGAALEDEVRRHTEITERAKAAELRRSAAAQARSALEAAQTSHDTMTLGEATDALATAQDAHTEATTKVVQLRHQLELAEQALVGTKATLGHAMELRDSARQREVMVASWKEAISKSEDEQLVEPEQLALALHSMYEARLAVERGAVVRRARAQLLDAIRHSEAAANAQREAARLRQAASGCEEVLAGAMAGAAPAGLRIKDGRLVLDTERGETFFAELSHGERWKLAIDLTLEALGDARLIHIPQEAWAALDADARATVQRHALLRRTVVVTAEADYDEVGPLRAEVLGAA